MDREDIIVGRRVTAGPFFKDRPGLNTHVHNTESFGWTGELRTFDGIVFRDAPLKVYTGAAFADKPVMIRTSSGYWGYVESHKEFSYISDIYSSFDVGYSLRKLNSAYSGSCIRIRRASDNTELDIGYVGKVWDIASALSFCAGTDGYIRTWYDNFLGFHLEQVTAANQPQIIAAGAPITLNGKVCIKLTTSQYLGMSFPFNYGGGDHSFWILYAKENGSVNDGILISDGSSYLHLQYGSTFYNGNTTVTGLNMENNTFYLNSLVNSGAVAYVHKNGRFHNSAADAVSNEIWQYLGLNTFRASTLYVSELLVAGSAAPNRYKIENNINKYYGVYV